MKRGQILNPDLSYLLASLGNGDKIAIVDAGLPIPEYVNRIDLSLKRGVPSFKSVLKVITEEMIINKIILSEEIKKNNPEMEKEIIDSFDDKVTIEYISHTKFKERVSGTKGVIRTGEITPYSNVILVSDVDFY